ncbi:unnamed protein product [Closterium sp. Naga37s-1]|nr:unnamed protein product [Closterium sp. Naga37s-1]
MHGRVGDGPAGAGACFVGGLLSVQVLRSRHSFRYSGNRPPPFGQTRTTTTESDSEEDEEDEDEEDEDEEGSGDEIEPGPKTHGDGEGGGDEDDELDGLEPEEEEGGVGERGVVATEAASQHEGGGGGSGGVKVLLILCNRHCGEKNFILSRWTVSRDMVVFATAALHAAIAELLAKERELGCKVSYSIDMCTAPNGKAWLVVRGHWIDETFQQRTAVLEFREMHGRHGGEEMAKVVEETVVQRGLQERCVGVWVALTMEVPNPLPLLLCSVRRCLAHVINLAVQAALSVETIREVLKIMREMAS